MRVISGKYKGIKLEGFDINGTRPTMDRVKESMFAMIQDKIKDSVCLDLFAGSGSLGIEAISNGASICYFVDKGKQITKILNTNLLKIHSDYKLIIDDYKNALKKFKDEKVNFDLIFLDPPYKENLINDVLKFIYVNNLLKDNGLIICEYEGEIINFENYNLIKHKKYGTKHISIFSK